MKVIFIVLDGWGFSLQEQGNAIAKASLPTLDYIQGHYPSCLLKASGISVGLPWGEPGNSEVGHFTLGSGRITLQAMPRIIEAIRDGSFFSNAAFLKAIEHVKQNNSQLHVMGLLGTGSVHSYIDHLYGLLELAARQGISDRVKLHLFMDGDDSPPQEGAKLLAHVNLRLDQTHQGQIASIIGRSFAMDRDHNWAYTQQAYELLTQGKGQRTKDEVKAMEEYYRKGLRDGYIPPTVVTDAQGRPKGLVRDNDSIIFFNYRQDSARQLTKAFVQPDKVEFKPAVPSNLVFVTMTEYEKDLPCEVAFATIVLENMLAQVLADAGKTQIHIAETHKYAHITYFFNGLHEQQHQNEEWQLIVSGDTTEFVSHPALKTPEITQVLTNLIAKNLPDFTLINLGNADVLAHTGNFAATVLGCQIIDEALKEILQALEQNQTFGQDWVLVVSADHGHAEAMLDPVSGVVLTEHTSNDVPFYLISPKFKHDVSALDLLGRRKNALGMLADIAPTILELMAIPQPAQMTSKSLLSELTSTTD